MSKSAVVTGGAGFIGRHLVKALLKSGWTVKVVDSGVTGRLGEIPSEIEVVKEDIASIDSAGWRRVVCPGDTVFHLAAQKHNTPNVSAKELVDTNVAATWNLAQACAEIGVRRLVFTSSLYAHGGLGPDDLDENDAPAPRTLYGVSKLAGEHILRALGETGSLSWNCARLFFTYGPGQFAEGGYKSVIVKSFQRITAGERPVRNGSGQQELDYIFVDDVVAALIELAESDKQGLIVNVGSGQGYAVGELLERIVRVSGSESLDPIVAPPDWTEGTRRVGSQNRISEHLVWRPSVSIDEGLQQTWKEFSKRA